MYLGIINVTVLPSVFRSEFEAHALEILRRVEASGEPVLITDHGRPVLRLGPYYGDDDALLASLRGSVLEYHDPTEPVGVEDWEALR